MYINSKIVLLGLVSTAGTNAKFSFYAAPQPSPGVAAGSTALADVIVPGALGTIADATTKWTLTIGAATPDADIPTDGTCTWARLTDSADAWIADFTVSGVGGGGDIILRNNTNIYSGGTVSITSATISVDK